MSDFPAICTQLKAEGFPALADVLRFYPNVTGELMKEAERVLDAVVSMADRDPEWEDEINGY